MRFVGGNDGRVFVVDKQRVIDIGIFEWGTKLPSEKCRELAKIILRNLLDDPMRIERFYTRFMHRTVMTWENQKPWTATSDTLLPIIEDIERVEKEAQRDIQRMRRELPRGVTNEGAAIPGDSQWGGTHNPSNQAPTIRRNDPWSEKK